MSIPASVPPPAAPGFQSKGRARAAANNKKYGTPLPVLLPESPLYARALAHPSPRATIAPLGLFDRTPVVIPRCAGVLDRATQSVFVEEEEDMRALFNRGFFGKGALSRSDPAWRAGRVAGLRGGAAATAERVREERRLARKAFKIERAAAMLAAAKKAEAVLTAKKGKAPAQGAAGEEGGGITEDGEGEGAGEQQEGGEGDGEAKEEGGEEQVDAARLTPQTFLVRPTRPDANRNRGKKAFKRRPPPPKAQAGQAGEQKEGEPAQAAQQEQAPRPPRRREPAPEPASESSESEDEAARLVQEREHLQLSYPEALFLCALGVLQIFDPEENAYVPQGREVMALLTPIVPGSVATELRPDDPLLVTYAAYQHYRALGWCVRAGVKFCVDWLLYRRGPVFSHSAFSILIIPVYMTNEDRDTSPYAGTDFYAEKQSWKWINTIMRVNSLVMKTVIVAYVTIPSAASFKTYGGDMARIMGQYSVREVSLLRFSPARRRD